MYIFTKSFILSYFGPVTLFTGDGDYLGFSRYFYECPGRWAAKQGFPLPEYSVDVVKEFADGEIGFLGAGSKEVELFE